MQVQLARNERLVSEHYGTNIFLSLLVLAIATIVCFLMIRDMQRAQTTRLAVDAAQKATQMQMEKRHRQVLALSHDLKVPLSSILGYLELYGPGAPADSLESMRRSGKHILDLLDNLLTYSSLEQGRSEYHPSSFSAITLCHELQEMFRPMAQQKNLNWVCHCRLPETEALVVTDRLKVKQILVNLISNGLKYTEQGFVKLSVSRSHKHLIFRVEDSGSGLNDHDRTHLFEPFALGTNREPWVEGSGYGLYVVKGLADLLQAHISIHSHLNEGTTLEISIPLEPQPIKPDPPTPNPLPSALPGESPQRRILLIDDDPAFIELERAMLRRLNQTADSCESWTDFLQLNLAEYDWILCDQHLWQDHHAHEVLDHLRRQSSQTALALVTAQSAAETAQWKQKGFAGCLLKPFSLNELSALLQLSETIATPRLSAISTAPKTTFKRLETMLDQDPEAITQVLQSFLSSSRISVEALKNTQNFQEIRALCHKLSTMMTQLEAQEASAILKKIETCSDLASSGYQGWSEDLQILLSLYDTLCVKIEHHLDLK